MALIPAIATISHVALALSSGGGGCRNEPRRLQLRRGSCRNWADPCTNKSNTAPSMRRRQQQQVGIVCSSGVDIAAQTAAEDGGGGGGEALVAESVGMLKRAAKTRSVAAPEVFAAMRALEKAKLDPSGFLPTIGGSGEPRTWMLIFTSSKRVVTKSMKGGQGGGSYFPITAIQKFDANAMTIENGVYLGPLGYITFQGRISWKNRILAFLFEFLNIKIGSLGPFKFNIQKKEDEGRVPTTKDPFFIWFYADEEIIVARGRGGGMALWCRCARVPT